MTRLKPTVSPAFLEEFSDRIERLNSLLAEGDTMISNFVRKFGISSVSLPYSPDFSADRYDNGLRTVHITSVDGKQRMHWYRAGAPAGSASHIPSGSTEATTQTVNGSVVVKKTVGHPELSFSEISLGCLRPDIMSMTQHEEAEETFCTTPIPSLKVPTPCIPPTSPEIDRIHDDSTDPRSTVEKAFCHGRQTARPFIIPSALLMIMPWILSKYLILPWLTSIAYSSP
ncbi:uncharacterized protein M421DRAFT_399116 [Didymella exigua CBS 183.55]|uniref:Uncharacterized protein n=1 Tax=Didymella exigua CBS 183.55 TaxID=1150837 RepID=A0A6A5S093_9PLEO|nr:uncharacterized protein M421DRAFT_399116 [Didymella exigua CBS 183.55]KAF1932698.1 hypothetical protein M421DRAFT_399116 [Didymella exigua CBS 183.55]